MAIKSIQLNSLTWRERGSVATIASIYALRMLGLFMIMPIFATYARDNLHAAEYLIGIAIGSYGLTQALLQLPLGMLSDHYGRKSVIFVGLALFALGSIVSALASTVYGIIIGRSLQGAGAIGSVLMATVADTTREHVRARAMAYLGATIGVSFMLAMMLGSLLNQVIGIQAIFSLSALLALLAILFTGWFIPSHAVLSADTLSAEQQIFAKQQVKLAKKLQNFIKQIFTAELFSKKLAHWYFSVFCLHAIMAAWFLVIPLMLRNNGFPDPKLWLLYSLTLVIAFIIAMAVISWLEPNSIAKKRIISKDRSKKRIKNGHNLSIFMLLLSIGLLFYANNYADNADKTSLVTIIVSMMVFFSGVSILEASLPAQISKDVAAHCRGTALGIFSSAQFLGIFAGGMLGGLLHSCFGMTMVLIFCMLLATIWLVSLKSWLK